MAFTKFHGTPYGHYLHVKYVQTAVTGEEAGLNIVRFVMCMCRSWVVASS